MRKSLSGDWPALVSQVRSLRYFKALAACFTFILLTSIYFFSTHKTATRLPQYVPATLRGSTHDQLVTFWAGLEFHLKDTKPECSPIRINRKCSVDSLFRHVWLFPWSYQAACNIDDMQLRPGVHEKPRPEYVKLNQRDIDKLKHSHSNMVAAAKTLAPQLPYVRGSKGFVMVGGGAYNFLTLLSLRMLRKTGSQLPVEVFMVTPEEYDEEFCERQLPALNAKCRLLSDVLSTTPDADPISQYQYKIFAILFSTYEDVFFLDADAFPAFNPDDVLETEPFASTGLVLWPDLWAETSSPIFFQMAGLPVPPVRRFASDSGLMLYSKAKHASSLLLASYYNYYGPDYYYSLLSQGAHGVGDKETYLHAAVALGLDFWDVKTPIWQAGQWIDHQLLRRVSMVQHHPGDDYNHTNADIYRHNRPVRPFVLHVNNPWKMLPRVIFVKSGPTWLSGGRRPRIFGTKEDVVASFGYDIEAVIWGEFVTLACEQGTKCEEAKIYYKAAIEGT